MTTRQLTTATVTVDDLRQVVAAAIARQPEAASRIEKGAAIVLLRAIVPIPSTSAASTSVGTEPGARSTASTTVERLPVCRPPAPRYPCGHLWAVELLAALARRQGASAGRWPRDGGRRAARR